MDTNRTLVHLMAQMLEAHDRERFEVTLVSAGADDGSEMRQRLKRAGHAASPETALAQLRRIQRQRVSINQGTPISGISNINRDQAELFSAMSLRKPVPDTQLSLL